MQTMTVSEKGEVVIPVQIRRQLGIAPGCQLDFSLEGQVIRVAVNRPMVPTTPQEGFGMLVCKEPGQRRLADFDVAKAMREAFAATNAAQWGSEPDFVEVLHAPVMLSS
ncbi:MAG: AbrB/MazE/SpoVT family DNA-binding domain-containing protein [Rhodoferax sp.]|nr:AbrB/MazE/SpoVT family DNA-binding domain-containing protein [Rhodoferax sp.]